MTDEVMFAAVGDVHGHQHLMVERLTRWEVAAGSRLGFVLQVGDFEPHRHEADLVTKTGPARYKRLGDFPDFLHGRAKFPWPVYAIGGNHEPYGWLDEMAEGGVLAPNCSYLGRAGCTEIEGLRVAFLSGIYSPKAFDTAGLSGQSATGSVAGTPVFMPRQQVIDFKYARPEVDVWAAAASLYAMLTGAVPRDLPPGRDPW